MLNRFIYFDGVIVLALTGLPCSLGSGLAPKRPQSSATPPGLTPDPDVLSLGQGLDGLQSYRAHQAYPH
jgi:hypothetical protein